MHKYLFGTHFTIVTDNEALQFIYNPNRSLAKSSAAMVQRWSVALAAYSYDIRHRKAQLIPHADYLSRYAKSEEMPSRDCLLSQPLPVSRSDLVQETRKYYHAIVSCVRQGWRADIKRRFPDFYKRREEISLTCDGILCFNDRTIVPPSLRSAVLDDLHSGHMGIEKMKSLARLTCWWPELNADLCRIAKSCKDCTHKSRASPSQWTPWPMSSESWQRVHADYCGPFLDKYYALIIIDSYSRWPEVYFTTSANADFTITAFSKTFSREGVPHAVVTDNGSHFAATKVTDWLKSIGCHHVLAPPRHPQSNGAAENFVRTLKSAISSIQASTFNELERGVDNFLMQYRNAVHSTTGSSPAKLFKNRVLRTNLLSLESAEVVFHRGNELRPSRGIVLNQMGQRLYRILDLEDGSIHRRHMDQIICNIPVSDPILECTNSSVSESVPEANQPTELSENINEHPRRSERLRFKERPDYNNPERHSSCGGCDDCK